MRRRIALAVVLFHVVLMWLLAAGFRTRLDPPAPEPQFVTLWLDPPVADLPPTPPQVQPRTQLQPPPSSTASRANAPRPQPAAEPQLTAPLIAPVAPVPDSTAPPVAIAPSVDWNKAGDLAAKRMGEALGAPPKAEPFGGEPKGIIPKPCVPKERSMEWKGGANPGVHWAGPFPVFVTKRCAITIGFFTCNLGWLPPPNDHLLDDMQDPNRARSSVPDPKICD